MRGVMIIGLVVVSLIIGLLVIKNMGVDSSGGITETQAKNYIEKAERTADKVNDRVQKFNKRAIQSEAD